MEEYFLGEELEEDSDSTFRILNAFFIFNIENDSRKNYLLLMVYFYCISMPENSRKWCFPDFFNSEEIQKRLS